MTVTRRSFLSLPGALAFVAIAAGPTSADTAIHEVEISVFQFQPSAITIAAGDTVRWMNSDGIEHSATASLLGADGTPVFDTGLFEKGENGEVTFAEPGTYDYFCVRHPSMEGQVVVTN